MCLQTQLKMFWRTLSMYLTNKYTKWYKSIIANAIQRVNNDGSFEKHHIIPKSLGGTNIATNLVKLTPKEHYICHLLLTKMVEGAARQKMWYAHYMMMRGINRYKPTARMYDIARRNLVEANKLRPGPSLGKKMSEETKQKISRSQKGIPKGPKTDEHKAKLGKYIRTDRHKVDISNMRKSQIGLFKHSEETKSKMSAWQKGVPKTKLTCQHCGKITSDLNHKRWHGDNCKALC